MTFAPHPSRSCRASISRPMSQYNNTMAELAALMTRSLSCWMRCLISARVSAYPVGSSDRGGATGNDAPAG